jgi:hypothetical protein
LSAPYILLTQFRASNEPETVTSRPSTLNGLEKRGSCIVGTAIAPPFKKTGIPGAATLAKVALRFEVFPDRDVNHVLLECTQEIIPVLIRYDRQTVLEFPLDVVQDDAVVRWFDERIVTFVKVCLDLVRQDAAFKEHLKDDLGEDAVARIRFLRYLAFSSLEHYGKTYYFVDEDSRREFEKQPTVA